MAKSVFETAASAGFPNASFAVRTRDGREGRIDVSAIRPEAPLADHTLHIDDVAEAVLIDVRRTGSDPDRLVDFQLDVRYIG